MKKTKEIKNRIWKDLKSFIPAAIGLVIYYLVVHLKYDAFCPMLVVTGIPCAGCGLTRAGLFLISGQVQRAAYINPMIFPIAAFLIYCCYFRYIKGAEIKGLRVCVGILIVAALVLYGIRMYLYFPGRVPYIYQKNNMLAELLPWYESWVNQFSDMLCSLRAN